MENAADALKMAASVLIFVIALTICINSFSQARRTSQILLDYQDREYDYTYVEENKDTNGNSITERIVGAEAIIPTIYKAYLENYKIVFEDFVLYQKRQNDGTWLDINYIDLENEAIGSEANKREFINSILYGASSEIQKKFERNNNIRLKTNKGLYDYIKSRKFKESLGVYYQEEVYSTGTSTPDAEKHKKRIITYSIN